jgi:hypothetical protein
MKTWLIVLLCVIIGVSCLAIGYFIGVYDTTLYVGTDAGVKQMCSLLVE